MDYNDGYINDNIQHFALARDWLGWPYPPNPPCLSGKSSLVSCSMDH